MRAALSFGLASIARKDSSAMRKEMLQCFFENHFLAAELWERLESIKHLWIGRSLILLKAFIDIFRYQLNYELESKVIVYQYPNEAKVLLPIAGLETGSIQWSAGWQWNSSHGAFLLKTISLKNIQQIYRVAQGLIRRNSLLVAMRQIQFIVGYSYFFHSLSRGPKEYFCSTESNPEVLAVIMVAKRLGLKTVYINHGHLDKELGHFAFDRYLLSGEAVRERITPFQKNPYALFESYQMQVIRALKIPQKEQIRNILVFTPVALNVELLDTLLRDIQYNWPHAHVHLRIHPNTQLIGARLNLQVTKQVSLTNNRRLFIEDLKGKDIAIGGGSSAHLEALCEGVPTFYFNMDQLPEDHYGFIEKKLIPQIQSTRKIETIASDFYRDPLWRRVFSYFQHNQEQA